MSGSESTNSISSGPSGVAAWVSPPPSPSSLAEASGVNGRGTSWVAPAQPTSLSISFESAIPGYVRSMYGRPSRDAMTGAVAPSPSRRSRRSCLRFLRLRDPMVSSAVKDLRSSGNTHESMRCIIWRAQWLSLALYTLFSAWIFSITPMACDRSASTEACIRSTSLPQSARSSPSRDGFPIPGRRASLCASCALIVSTRIASNVALDAVNKSARALRSP
mmetsp:Transcript_30697/g.99852  ORF Transcript_30697/g.99852 Transcript_30697/m.99852 type:complete len:219 (+) Transcript_30697:469-1125(+)